MYKIIFRSIFYQWLFLLVGISLGFVVNAEWLGYKSALIERSINNIFFPLEFTPEVEASVKNIGAAKIYAELNQPSEFEILGDVVYYNNDFYWCKYKYRDKSNRLQFGEATTRVKWKTWEYDYGSHDDIINNDEKMKEDIYRLNLWHSKIRQAIEQADTKQKILIEQEKKLNNNELL